MEQLQQQHLREFHARLESAQAELSRVQKERDAERKALEEQRASERSVLERWSNEKDASIESLRQHFLQREQMILQTQRSVEERFHQQRLEWIEQTKKEQEARDEERRMLEAVKVDQQQQIHSLLQQVQTLQEQLNTKTITLDSKVREFQLLSDTHARMERKVKEAADRMALVDSLESQLLRLQSQLKDQDAILESKERWWKEKEEEIERREHRLRALQQELDAQEQARREMRRRERREGLQYQQSTTAGGAFVTMNKTDPDLLDCAWRSGPIDRTQLITPNNNPRHQHR